MQHIKSVSNFYALYVNRNYSQLNDTQNSDASPCVSFEVKGKSR